MSISTWLTPVILSVLAMILSGALGGIFVRRGTFKSTYDLLQQKVQTYDLLQQMDDRQLKQTTAERDAALKERDAAIAERDAEKIRSARLDRALTDCQLDKADLERALARLGAGPQP